MKRDELKQIIREVIEEELKRPLNESYQVTLVDPETGQEVDADVEYEYYRGSMGRRVGMARFAEPDEPAQVEIQSITTADGKEIDPDLLDDTARENLEQSIMDSHGEPDYDDHDD